MSWTKEISVFCDVCGNWESYPGFLGVHKVRKKLKARGWKYIKGKDYCPTCVKDGKRV